jgi:hypothetical protein
VPFTNAIDDLNVLASYLAVAEERREPERDDGVSDKRQRQKTADLRAAEPELRKVEDEDDRDQAIAEQPQAPCAEQESTVVGQRPTMF